MDAVIAGPPQPLMLWRTVLKRIVLGVIGAILALGTPRRVAAETAVRFLLEMPIANPFDFLL